MMPGLARPPGMMAPGPRFRSLTYIAQSSSTGTTIAIPAETQPGDLLLGLDRAYTNGGTPTDVPWDGWVKITSRGGLDRRINSYFKAAAADDAGKIVTGMNGANSDFKFIAVLRPNVPLKGVALGASDSVLTTDDNPAPITVQASLNKPPLVVVGYYSTSLNDIDPRTFSPTKDGEVAIASGGPLIAYFAWRLFPASPQDVTIDMDDEGSGNSIHGAAIILS